MTIYLAYEDDYEGIHIYGAFSTYELADEFARARQLNVQEFVVDERVGEEPPPPPKPHVCSDDHLVCQALRATWGSIADLVFSSKPLLFQVAKTLPGRVQVLTFGEPSQSE